MEKKNLLLFDIDGTLTPARETIDIKLVECLKKAQKKFDIAIVGGSDREKQKEQLGEFVDMFKYSFSENGTLSFENGVEMHRNSISKHLGEDKFQELINFCLLELSKIKIPLKRGTFIEYRSGMINVSPIGRGCAREERKSFVEYNKTHQVLPKLADKIRAKFKDDDIFVSIGGQISMDIFPRGWDKTYCLQFIDQKYKDIHFFGDKYYQGGNDYEIYEHKRTIGHKIINGPEETIKEIEKLL